ncbi:MAG TPA: DUF5666 domain-containing protein [Burkholderiales bacterium]|nr:DUF5666 domain-containing protein [Burkholderiales bacterium]
MSPLHSHLKNALLGLFTIFFLLLLLTGCGSGVDSGGTGAAAASASGPITGFGSVIVNGVHFDESHATITDADGTPHHRDDLKLGMTTQIRGSALVVNANETRSIADSIVFSSAILGPIESIDTQARKLTVLGQSVDVSSMTIFDDSLTGGLTALAVGDVILVYALFDGADSTYSATRIEPKSGVAAYELRGVANNLNTSLREFSIGKLRISYAGIDPKKVPPSLANGRLVRLKLQTAMTTGVVNAMQVLDGVNQLGEHDEVRIEGLISSSGSNGQFTVEGVPVDAAQAGVSGNAGLGVGMRVEVEGTVSSGVLVATKVHSKTQKEVEGEGFELDGSIAALDPVNRTLVVRGISVDYSGTVEFRDGTIADMAVGKKVEIKGTLSSDRTGLSAVRIKFKH